MKKERKIETSDMILGGTNRHILGSPSRNRKIGCWTMRQQANRSPLFKAGEPPVYFLMENVELIFFKEDLFLCHSARVQGRLFGSIVKCVVALFGSNSSKSFLCLQSEEKQTRDWGGKKMSLHLFIFVGCFAFKISTVRRSKEYVGKRQSRYWRATAWKIAVPMSTTHLYSLFYQHLYHPCAVWSNLVVQDPIFWGAKPENNSAEAASFLYTLPRKKWTSSFLFLFSTIPRIVPITHWRVDSWGALTTAIMQWKWKTDASSSSFFAPEEEEGGITIPFLLLPGARRGKRGKYGTQSAIQRTVCTHPVCAREREGERRKGGKWG